MVQKYVEVEVIEVIKVYFIIVAFSLFISGPLCLCQWTVALAACVYQ